MYKVYWSEHGNQHSVIVNTKEEADTECEELNAIEGNYEIFFEDYEEHCS